MKVGRKNRTSGKPLRKRAYALFAGFPEVGSVRVGRGWHQSTGQAYFENAQAVMHCNGTPSMHHRMYVPNDISPPSGPLE
ncbi:MAG: hypothetical protein AAB489_05355 [Patescibacteria group bacterium]